MCIQYVGGLGSEITAISDLSVLALLVGYCARFDFVDVRSKVEEILLR